MGWDGGVGGLSIFIKNKRWGEIAKDVLKMWVILV